LGYRELQLLEQQPRPLDLPTTRGREASPARANQSAGAGRRPQRRPRPPLVGAERGGSCGCTHLAKASRSPSGPCSTTTATCTARSVSGSAPTAGRRSESGRTAPSSPIKGADAARHARSVTDLAVVPGSAGSSKVNIAIDAVNLQAKTQLGPPSFAQGQHATLVGVAGAALSDRHGGRNRPVASRTVPRSTPPRARRGGRPRLAGPALTRRTSWPPAVRRTPSSTHHRGRPGPPACDRRRTRRVRPDATYAKSTLDTLDSTWATVEASIGMADDSTFLVGPHRSAVVLVHPAAARASRSYGSSTSTAAKPTSPKGDSGSSTCSLKGGPGLDPASFRSSARIPRVGGRGPSFCRTCVLS